MRRVVVASVVVAVTLLLPGRAMAAPHSFDGSCQITGIVSFESWQSESLTFEGSGTCTGVLDGAVVQDTPISVGSAGEVRGFAVPILGYGAGDIDFTEAGFSFPFAYQQLGTLLRVYPACMGCAGVAFAPIDPVTPTQPSPEPEGPRSAIRIVIQTARTFVTA